MKRSLIITLALIAAIAVPLCASSGWARGLGVLGMCGGAGAPGGASAPIQLIGTSTAGSSNMENSPNHVYFHKISGLALSNGKLSKYRVTIAAASTGTRAINLGLYSHDAVNNKPSEFITGSDCGWINYTQGSGETFECTPLGVVSLVAGQQYWVGVRGKEYGGIRGDSSGGTYYDFYLTEGDQWENINNLSNPTTQVGVAGILQIEITQ